MSVTFSIANAWDQLRAKKPTVTWWRIIWFSKAIPRFAFITWLAMRNQLKTPRVAHRLEKLQRDILWGSIGEEKRFHLIRWDKVCLPLQYGGLAIKNLRLFNQALLGKWIWRFGTEHDFLRRKVIEAKYGSARSGWCSNPMNSPNGVSLWKTISKDWSSFKRFISFDVGDGSRVSFWHDVWCGDNTLKATFPTLFAIACNPAASVEDLHQIYPRLGV
jgi:hypothetical protein